MAEIIRLMNLRDFYPLLSISTAENRECYGKPCACLTCETGYCTEFPCDACKGRDSDRTSSVCLERIFNLVVLKK